MLKVTSFTYSLHILYRHSRRRSGTWKTLIYLFANNEPSVRQSSLNAWRLLLVTRGWMTTWKITFSRLCVESSYAYMSSGREGHPSHNWRYVYSCIHTVYSNINRNIRTNITSVQGGENYQRLTITVINTVFGVFGHRWLWVQFNPGQDSWGPERSLLLLVHNCNLT